MRKWCIGAIVIAMLVAPSLAACPNKCSGHGKCGKSDVCDCMQNWTGGDCAGRVCPFTRAWHDTAEGNNDAHYYAECGNRGICNRETGVCECDEPFTGSGCRRMGCPGDCSGHGTCEFIEELAADGYNKRVGGNWLRTYTLWDQEKIMGCRCDPGFEGHNCARRTCPKGDDPLTEIGTEMVQVITFTMLGSGFLTYHDPNGNAWTTDRIIFDDGTPTDVEACANVQEALRRLPNNVLNTVDVAPTATYYPFVRTARNSEAGSIAGLTTVAAAPVVACTVKFRSEAGTTGYQNLLECDVSVHNAVGQHPMTAGNGVAGVCTVEEVWIQPLGSTLPTFPATAATRPLTELAECSNRGSCDYTTGMCKCFTGHMGLACQKQEALV